MALDCRAFLLKHDQIYDNVVHAQYPKLLMTSKVDNVDFNTSGKAQRVSYSNIN